MPGRGVVFDAHPGHCGAHAVRAVARELGKIPVGIGLGRRVGDAKAGYAIGIHQSRVRSMMQIRDRVNMCSRSIPYARTMKSENEKPDNDETKRKFREALERKRKGEQARPGHLDGDSSIQGTHDRANHKREFRRKSG